MLGQQLYVPLCNALLKQDIQVLFKEWSTFFGFHREKMQRVKSKIYAWPVAFSFQTKNKEIYFYHYIYVWQLNYPSEGGRRGGRKSTHYNSYLLDDDKSLTEPRSSSLLDCVDWGLSLSCFRLRGSYIKEEELWAECALSVLCKNKLYIKLHQSEW